MSSPLLSEDNRGKTLRADKISVAFHGFQALSNVDFVVTGGELVGLIGPNGSGKTTLLNVLSGYQKPQSGCVDLGGAQLHRLPPERVTRKGIGRTFQGARPFPRLTVRENVELGALGIGVSRREARSRAAQLMEALALTPAADLPARTLPAGSQRRLGIARALAGDPAIVLLDEPAAGLDDSETAELIHFLRVAHATRECAIVLVEHDMRVIMGLCERVYVLNQGETLAEGSPSAIRQNPSVLEAYLGSAGHTEPA